MDTLERSGVSADPRRRAALLQHVKSQNSANETWDRALSYGKWLFFIFAPVGLVLFGAIWPSRKLLTGFGICLFLVGLMVMVTALMRNIFGFQSVWHKFRGEKLFLGDNYLEFSMSGAAPGLRGDSPYVWRMKYQDVRRMEYDRKFKTLRIVGRFDEENSKKADVEGLPKGMRPMKHPENRPDGAVYLEFFLIFPDSERLLEELEERCGVYIHPARRADDMADLRDLPGIKPEKPVIKPMAGGLTLFMAMFLVALGWQSKWLEQNPYRPYPPTEESMLGRTFDINEPAVLDGLRITLKSVSLPEEGSGERRILFDMENTCGEAVLFHTALDSQSNVSAAVMTRSGLETRRARGTEDSRRVLIEPGGIYEMELYVRLYPEDEQIPLVIFINSDLWPPERPFWREEYVGVTVDIGGKKAKSNEVVFKASE